MGYIGNANMNELNVYVRHILCLHIVAKKKSEFKCSANLNDIVTNGLNYSMIGVHDVHIMLLFRGFKYLVQQKLGK